MDNQPQDQNFEGHGRRWRVTSKTGFQQTVLAPDSSQAIDKVVESLNATNALGMTPRAWSASELDAEELPRLAAYGTFPGRLFVYKLRRRDNGGRQP